MKNLPKNYAIYVGGAIVVLLLIVLSMSGFFARRHIVSQCSVGMDCVCFKNIVNNRLTKTDVRAFNKFLKAIRVRPTASILEFTDEQSAQRISASIGVCRPAQVAPQPAAKPAPKAATDSKTKTTNKKKAK